MPNGNGSTPFTVRSAASTGPLIPTVQACTGERAIPATAGVGGAFYFAPITFAPPSVPAAGTPRCNNEQVAVSDTGEGGAAGHENQVLVFTNDSRSVCTLTGYPGVAGLNSGGTESWSRPIVHWAATWAGWRPVSPCSPWWPWLLVNNRVSHCRGDRQPARLATLPPLPGAAGHTSEPHRAGTDPGLRPRYPRFPRLFGHRGSPGSSRQRRLQSWFLNVTASRRSWAGRHGDLPS